MQLISFILILTITSTNSQIQILASNNLPIALRLGSAIVAAVEKDAEQEEQMFAHKAQVEKQALIESIANIFNSNDTEAALAARGKYHKQKKLIKYIYPLVMGILLAKTVLIPLMLKLLTAVSTSSFVMSKISLAASAMLFLKWIIGSNKSNEAKDRVEIIHVPVIKDAMENAAWPDNTWSGSNVYEMKNNKYRLNYIPLGGAKDISFTTPPSYHRYPQHNYYASYEPGKPFL